MNKSFTSDTGLSLLSALDRYWVKRSSSQPKAIADERLICISPEHWIKYVFPSVLYAFLLTAALALLVSAVVTASTPFAFTAFFISGLSVLLTAHHWFFWYLLAESQTVIIVTNKRVIYLRDGLLWYEDMIDIAYEKMKTVETHKGSLLQSLFNYGTLQFEPVKIRRVPHPGTLTRQIEQAMGLM
jgi:hypothetical protein